MFIYLRVLLMLLTVAVQDGDYNRIEQLLVQRSDIIVDIDCKDKRTGNTALIWAAKKGHNKVSTHALG